MIEVAVENWDCAKCRTSSQEVSGLSLDKKTSAGLPSLATGCKLEPISLPSSGFLGLCLRDR